MKSEVGEKAASKTSFKEEMTEKIDKQTKRKNEISPENNSLEENRLEKSRFKKDKSEEARSEANRYNLSGKMLYVSDLDGTLLNTLDDLEDSVNRLIDKGLCFTVATARTYATVNSIVKDVHLTYPMILMNGVMLYDPVSKSCINAEIIERDSVEYILKGRKKFGVTGFAYALSPEISEETLESEIASNLEKNLKSGVASNLKKNSNTGEENQIQKSGRKMATYYEKIATEHMEKFYVERRDVYHKPFSKVEKLEDILDEYNDKLEDISDRFETDKKDGSKFFIEQMGIDKQMYLSTVVSTQEEVRLDEKNQNMLIQKIANLAGTGEDNVSYKKALIKLQEKIRDEIGTNKTSQKPINIIEKEIVEINNKIVETEKYRN